VSRKMVAPQIAAFLAALLGAACAPAAGAVRALRVSSNDGTSVANAPDGLQRGLQQPRTSQPLTRGASRATVPVKPQLFFLFLTYSKINNEAVWDRFFATAVRGVDYQALVHCKSEASCRTNIRSLHRFEIIPSVQTQYCFDLVSGTNALLRAALMRAGAGSANDKYIMVSDSTLPVKPFTVIQQQLTADTSSDFCVFPRNEWAEVTERFVDEKPSQKKVGVKHHQWVVLGREHAMLAAEKAGTRQDLMHELQLNMGFKNTGCLDEFWYFAVLFDSFNLSGRPTNIHLKNFNGAPLSTNNYEVQGRCDTFVHWVPRASGTNNNMTRLAEALLKDPGTDITQATDTRPASMSRFSRAALATMRSSPFLFVRKVDEGTAFSGCESLDDAFDSVVFSTPPRALASIASVWRGQGTWLDNKRSPVSITGKDGSIRVIGGSEEMNAKGSYCRDRISVAFKSGYKAQATLSGDGVQLIWHNGAVWGRLVDGT